MLKKLLSKKQTYDRGFDILKLIKNPNRFKISFDDWTFDNEILHPIYPAFVSDSFGGVSGLLMNEEQSTSSAIKITINEVIENKMKYKQR